MGSWLKMLVVMAIVVPLTAYVVGSLATSSAPSPGDRGPVIINDPPAPASTPSTTPSTPAPTQVGLTVATRDSHHSHPAHDVTEQQQ